jgi:hypothetical protein
MSTYSPIASQTLTSSVSSVAFTNIPQYFTDLIIIEDGNSTGSTNINMRFNNDSGSNYSRTRMYGDGSGVGSDRNSNQTSINDIIATTNSTTSRGNYIAQIQNYSNTTTYKTAIFRGNDSQYTMGAVGLWRSTSAINSIDLICGDAANFRSGSTFNLYGIAAGSAKAQGGAVTTDGTYWYHTFKGSGLFTVNQAITADYLVVAGGAGGGGANGHAGGGGGGAGGLRCTVTATGGGGSLPSALSLVAGEYAITVGAGGSGGIGTAYGTNGSNSIFSTITSTGGGGGAANTGTKIGSAGGSGGGGSNNETTGQAGGAGTANQGFNGGASGNANSSGGGGGAGAVGASGSSGTAGSGGTGVAT